MSMYGKYKDKVGPLDVSDWPTTDCTGDKGLAVQADRDEADINKIVARMQKTGQLPPMRGGEPFYGDVSDIGDLQESYIKIREAEEMFMAHPAEVREKFENDPVKFVDFLSDPDNLEEAVSLGLAVKRPDPAPAPIPPAPAPVQ